MSGARASRRGSSGRDGTDVGPGPRHHAPQGAASPAPGGTPGRWTLVLGLLGAVAACQPPPAPEPPRSFDYPAPRTASCAGRAASQDLPASRAQPPDPSAVAARRSTAPGTPPPADGRVVERRFSYLVRTPSNYDPGFAHPLLVVHAAATSDAERSERFTGLTAPATGRGFIVAYVDHRPMSRSGVLALGGVAQSVAERWCIDPQRIFYTGHSDGGTVSTALALLPPTRDQVAAVAVSAAGFRRQDLDDLGCRAPMPVMVMHGSQDALFPGWGREAAAWWAACNACTEPPAASDADGCAAWRGCAAGAPVLYCEGRRTHTEWPGLQGRLLDFLAAAGERHGSGSTVRAGRETP